MPNTPQCIILTHTDSGILRTILESVILTPRYVRYVTGLLAPKMIVSAFHSVHNAMLILHFPVRCACWHWSEMQNNKASSLILSYVTSKPLLCTVSLSSYTCHVSFSVSFLHITLIYPHFWEVFFVTHCLPARKTRYAPTPLCR